MVSLTAFIGMAISYFLNSHFLGDRHKHQDSNHKHETRELIGITSCDKRRVNRFVLSGYGSRILSKGLSFMAAIGFSCCHLTRKQVKSAKTYESWFGPRDGCRFPIPFMCLVA